MTKTLRVLGLASALAFTAAAPGFAAADNGGGNLGSQHVTEQQLGNNGRNQMLPKSATGTGQTGTPGTYGMNAGSPNGTAYSNPQMTTSGPGSATNPMSPSPSGGGQSDSSGSSGGGGNGTGR